MFDYYKLYELAKQTIGNQVPKQILYGVLIFGIIMLISGIIIFFILDNESGEAIAAVLGVFGIIFLFLFAIIRDGNESLETNKKEFQRVIKEAKIKTTPEKIISEADKLKAFCSYYYSENDDFCSLNFQGEVDQRTFNKVFKRIYESKADENKDKVEKAFEYITK
jgi:hypothetical protein